MSVASSISSNLLEQRDDYDVFISYSRRDKVFVSQLCETLIVFINLFTNGIDALYEGNLGQSFDEITSEQNRIFIQIFRM